MSDTNHPDDPRIADIDLDYYGFPSECHHCGEAAVYPMGANESLTANKRECFSCGWTWWEG